MNKADMWYRIGLAGLLAAVGAISFVRAARLDYDFHHFYRDAAYVWQHGELNPDLDGPELERRQLPFYLPVVALLLSPLAALGLTGAAVVWALGQAACVWYIARTLRRWVCDSVAPERVLPVLLVTFVLVSPAVYEAARFNQLSFVILALCLAGFTALERGRDWRGGAWIGLAALVKLLPALLLFWLILKRRWRALGSAVGVAIVVAIVPSLAVFGPSRTLDYHSQWLAYNVGGSGSGQLLESSRRTHFSDYRNQSLAAVIGRWCWRDHPQALPVQAVDWSRQTCERVARGVLVLLAVGLFVSARKRMPRAGLATRVEQNASQIIWRAEFALYLSAMLVFAPLLRTYYYVWAWPALVLLTLGAMRREWGRGRRWARVAVFVWIAGTLLWVWPAARSAGAHWLMLALVGACLAGWISAARRARGAQAVAESAPDSPE